MKKALLIGLLLIGLRFYPSIAGGKVTYFGDNYSLQVPGKIFTAYWLKQGIIPWWNPTIFAGIPWTQELSQSVFYPTTLLFMFMDPGPALNWSVGLHLLFTFIGMYLLGKRWTNNDFGASMAAVLWTFSTQVTGSSNNLVTIQAIAWFPWISYWGLKLFDSQRNILIFSLFVLGQFLAGYPQHVIYAIFLGLFLSSVDMWKKISLTKWLTKWLITGLSTLGITAVVWLPFTEIFFQSTRIIQTNEQAAVGSLNILMIIKALIPYFFDNPASGIKWGPAWSGFPNSLFYITWIGLIALIKSFKRNNYQNMSMLIFIIFSLVFSLGNRVPGFENIQNLLPFFKFGRYPSMILVLTNIVLILLACKSLINLRFDKFKPIWLIYLTGILLLLIAGYYLLPNYFDFVWKTVNELFNNKLANSQFHTPERDYLILKNIFNNFLFNLFFFITIVYSIRRKKMFLAVFILGFDVLFNTQGMLFFGQKNIYPSWNEIDLSIQAENLFRNPQKRILTRNMNQPYTDYGMYWEALTTRRPFSDSFINGLELAENNFLKQIRDSYTPDWNMPFQINTINGYTTLLPQDFMNLWSNSGEPRINFVDKINLDNPKLSEWSVGNYIVDKQFEIKEQLPDSQPIALSETTDLYQLPSLPRFRYEDGTAIDISNLKENPNQINLTIDNDGHTEMIIADRFDKNWRLKINGVDEEVANYEGMRKAKLVPGNNYVEMFFVPLRFFIGLAISTISIVGIYLSSRIKVWQKFP